MAKKKGGLLTYGIPEGDTPASRSYYDEMRRQSMGRQGEAEQVAIDTAEIEAETKEYGAPIGSPKWYEMWEEKHRRSALRTELEGISIDLQYNPDDIYLQNRKAELTNQLVGKDIIKPVKSTAGKPFQVGDGWAQFDDKGNLKHVIKPPKEENVKLTYGQKKEIDALSKIAYEGLKPESTDITPVLATKEEQDKAKTRIQQIHRVSMTPTVREQNFQLWYAQLRQQLPDLDPDYDNEPENFLQMFLEGYSPNTRHYEIFSKGGLPKDETVQPKTNGEKMKPASTVPPVDPKSWKSYLKPQA